MSLLRYIVIENSSNEPLSKDFYTKKELKTILSKGYKIKNPIKFPLKWLSMSIKGIQKSMDNIRLHDKPSRSKGQPIEVFYDTDKDQFILTDGYHRLAELLLNIKYPERWVPEEYYLMANVNGGYNSYWKNIDADEDWWSESYDMEQEYKGSKNKDFYTF